MAGFMCVCVLASPAEDYRRRPSHNDDDDDDDVPMLLECSIIKSVLAYTRTQTHTHHITHAMNVDAQTHKHTRAERSGKQTRDDIATTCNGSRPKFIMNDGDGQSGTTTVDGRQRNGTGTIDDDGDVGDEKLKRSSLACSLGWPGGVGMAWYGMEDADATTLRRNPCRASGLNKKP